MNFYKFIIKYITSLSIIKRLALEETIIAVCYLNVPEATSSSPIIFPFPNIAILQVFIDLFEKLWFLTIKTEAYFSFSSKTLLSFSAF